MTVRLPTARSLGWAAIVTLVLVAALFTPTGPAAAHGFHLSISPQVSDGGTVTVESLFTMSDGFVVLHTNEGDGPGDPVGHVPVSLGYHSGVDVTATDRFWDDVEGTATLWVALHNDDGDGEFEPGTDRMASFAGSNAARKVPVRKSDDGRTFVVAGVRTQRTPDPVVFVRRVGLAEDGFVAIQADTGNGRRNVGHAPFDAGVHRLVRVPLNETFFASADDYLSLEAVVYHDDGDGEFTTRDAPVTVDGDPVATRLTVEKTNGSRLTPDVGGDTSSPSTAATPTPRLVTTATPTGTTSGATPTDTPGFTVGTALVALVVLFVRGTVQ